MALSLSRQANQAAKEANAMVRESERRAEREFRRLMAGTLQAWWVRVCASGSEEEWGVMVRNGSGDSTQFLDVGIDVEGIKGETSGIRIANVPPGEYFVKNEGGSAWGLPRVLSRDEEVNPIMKSKNHRITAISFTDQLGIRWQWDPKTGLKPQESAPQG